MKIVYISNDKEYFCIILRCLFNTETTLAKLREGK